MEKLPAEVITESEFLTKETVEKAVSQFDKNDISSFIERYMTACDGSATNRIIDYIKEIKDES